MSRLHRGAQREALQAAEGLTPDPFAAYVADALNRINTRADHVKAERAARKAAKAKAAKAKRARPVR